LLSENWTKVFIQGLRNLAEIVHDIDLKDVKFNRLEAAGLNAIINGLSKSLRDDRKVLQQTSAIFDRLFTLFGKQAKPVSSRRKTSRKK
jgi:hypothetical protein